MSIQWKWSFTTLACPTWTWPEILNGAREFGYDGIEIRGVAGELDVFQVPAFFSENHEQTARELAAKNLAICALGSSVRFDDTDSWKANVDTGKRWIDLAAAMDIPFVRVFGDFIRDPKDEERIKDQVARGLNELGRHAHGTPVQVVIETHGDFTRTDRLVDVFQQIDTPSAGILWDMHHPWRMQKERLHDTYERLKKWIRHIHVKDSVAKDDGTFRYTLAGEGEFPFDEAFQLLKHVGYDGWVSLEWEKLWHKHLEEPDVALAQFMAFVEHVT